MATATMVAGFDHHHHGGHSTSRMEEKKFEYFASINPMARKIMQEREKIKQKHGPAWEQMSSVEQDTAIDNCLMDPHIRSRYAMHRVDREEVVCYPKLLLQTGQKIVHFGDEDITWQDEHSAPFSWETKSQLDFSLSLGAAEQGVSSSQTADAKTTKSAPNSQLGKNTPSANKVSVSEGPGRRPEEESSFWKISAERSRMEGELADYTSLTPSQIKSMEKGEKPLPSYLRQETSVMASPALKEPELLEPVPAPAALAPAKSAKQRAPRPPAPPPPVPVAMAAPAPPVAPPAVISIAPPAVISIAPPAIISIAPGPAPVRVSSTVAGWERSQSTLPSVSNTVDDVFSGSMMSGGNNKASSNNKDRERSRGREAEGSAQLATSPTFAQFNTSNNLLKTGFDFLDNW